MSASDEADSPLTLDAVSVEEGVDRVLDVHSSLDRDEVTTELERVAEDGEITASSVSASVSEIPTIVDGIDAEFDAAADALDSAEEVAGELTDVPLVSSRLDTFRADIEALSPQIDEFTEQYEDLHARTESQAPTYDLISDIAAVRNELGTSYRQIESLREDIEAFIDWMQDPAEKLADLETDAEQIDTDLDEVGVARGHVQALTVDGSLDDETETEAMIAWANATMRLHLIQLAIDDLRWELEQLRTVAERIDATDPATDELLAELDDLADRRAELATELEEVEYPTWTGQYEAILWSFQDEMQSAEPPIDWGHVQSEFQEHREAIIDSAM